MPGGAGVGVAVRIGRQPPIPRWPRIDGKVPCGWCGDIARRPDGTPDPRRRWHPDCIAAYKVACWADSARKAVLSRDGSGCAACGTDTRRLRAQSLGLVNYGPNRRLAIQWPELAGPATHVAFGDVVEIEIDHVVPLWSVDRSLPWGEIKRFWSADNLQGLCLSCHRAKTAREAGERARVRRPQMALSLEAA